jgi:hypothetical protein
MNLCLSFAALKAYRLKLLVVMDAEQFKRLAATP